MQATGITVPQMEFDIGLLQCPSLEMCKVRSASEMKIMCHLLECTGEGNKQFVRANSQEKLYGRPICDELILGANQCLKLW